jgi:hypothetical protein
MTKYFDQSMHSSDHHHLKHLINGDKTLENLLLVFLITLTPNYFICSCPKFLRFLTSFLYDLLCSVLYQYVQNVQARVTRL